MKIWKYFQLYSIQRPWSVSIMLQVSLRRKQLRHYLPNSSEKNWYSFLTDCSDNGAANDNREREGTPQSPISPSKGEVLCVCTEISKWCPPARVCLIRPIMNLVILSWMKISVLHCTSSTKAKENCVERNCTCFFYIELAHLKEVERRKKEKEENWPDGDFWPIWSEWMARVPVASLSD